MARDRKEEKSRVDGSKIPFDPSKSTRGNVPPSPTVASSVTSNPLRSGPCDRIFTSVSNVLEEYIIHLGDYSQPLLKRCVECRLHWHSEFIGAVCRSWSRMLTSLFFFLCRKWICARRVNVSAHRMKRTEWKTSANAENMSVYYQYCEEVGGRGLDFYISRIIFAFDI